jgi:hypothetical protein
MTALWIVTLVVAAVVVLELALGFAIIRRLRDLGSRVKLALDLAQGTARASEIQALQPGQPIPGFQAIGTDGSEITSSSVTRTGALLAFFDANCDSCRAQMAELVSATRRKDAQLQPIVVVVSGDARRGDDLVKSGSSVGRVITEPEPGGLTTSFRIDIFPVFFVLGTDGTVSHRTLSVKDAVEKLRRPFVIAAAS